MIKFNKNFFVTNGDKLASTIPVGCYSNGVTYAVDKGVYYIVTDFICDEDDGSVHRAIMDGKLDIWPMRQHGGFDRIEHKLDQLHQDIVAQIVQHEKANEFFKLDNAFPRMSGELKKMVVDLDHYYEHTDDKSVYACEKKLHEAAISQLKAAGYESYYQEYRKILLKSN